MSEGKYKFFSSKDKPKNSGFERTTSRGVLNPPPASSAGLPESYRQKLLKVKEDLPKLSMYELGYKIDEIVNSPQVVAKRTESQKKKEPLILKTVMADRRHIGQDRDKGLSSIMNQLRMASNTQSGLLPFQSTNDILMSGRISERNQRTNQLSAGKGLGSPSIRQSKTQRDYGVREKVMVQRKSDEAFEARWGSSEKKPESTDLSGLFGAQTKLLMVLDELGLGNPMLAHESRDAILVAVREKMRGWEEKEQARLAAGLKQKVECCLEALSVPRSTWEELLADESSSFRSKGVVGVEDKGEERGRDVWEKRMEEMKKSYRESIEIIEKEVKRGGEDLQRVNEEKRQLGRRRL